MPRNTKIAKKRDFPAIYSSKPTGRFLKINIFIKPISVKKNGKTINLIKKIQGVNKVMPERKETKLLTDFQQGNKKAFERIYNLYWKGLYLHAYKRLHAEDLAEELVQELFIQLWEKRKEIKVEKSIQHYLYGVIKKKILHHLRERYREAAHHQAIRETAVTVNSHLEHRIEQRDMLQNIESLVQRLPAKSRRVFELSRKKFMSNKDIARQLNISEKAVEYHIHSSLHFIRTNCPDYLSYLFIFTILP